MLREIRRAKGWSQAELAYRLDCDQSIISRIERGERSVTLERLRSIAAALEVPLSALIADEVA